MNRCELAYQYHKKGYNCAQSVLMSFQDVAGLSEKQCLAIASGFGAGAGTGELCGALTGAIMVLDLLTQTDTEKCGGGQEARYGAGKGAAKAIFGAF